MRFMHVSPSVVALVLSALLTLLAAATAFADPIPPHWP
jgi:hypothetical protein